MHAGLPMRRASKVDTNQTDVVATLRACGLKVAFTHTLGEGKPDFVVSGYKLDYLGGVNRGPRLLWVELKSPGGKLTPAEEKFHQEWAGMPIMICETAEPILIWFGRLRP